MTRQRCATSAARPPSRSPCAPRWWWRASCSSCSAAGSPWPTKPSRSSAADAARAASLARPGPPARPTTAATKAAARAANQQLPCARHHLDLDVTGFAKPPGTAASVHRPGRAATSPTADLGLPGLPAPCRVKADLTSPIDTFREEAMTRVHASETSGARRHRLGGADRDRAHPHRRDRGRPGRAGQRQTPASDVAAQAARIAGQQTQHRHLHGRRPQRGVAAGPRSAALDYIAGRRHDRQRHAHRAGTDLVITTTATYRRSS